MEKKQKEKNKNFKLLSKKAFMGLAVASLMIASPVMLTGCGEKGDPGKDGAPGAPGKNGSAWYTGTQYDLSQGVVGDFFYDTDDGKIYRKNEGGWYLISTIKSSVSINSAGYWVIDGIQTNVKAKGENGTNGTNGTNGENGTDGLTPEIKNGYWWIGETNTEIKALGENGKSAFELSGFDGTVEEWIASLKGEKGDTGEKGDPGEKGEDGISCYVGYDGYIWNGSERTEFSVNASLPENVVENTIGIQGAMSKYFKNSYIDLSENTIALMANYMPTIKATQYSGTVILELKVVAENEGILHIGTAKVEDVVNARQTGDTYEVNTTPYLINNAGLNTITLELQVAEDETVVLGGNGSVGLFVAEGVTLNDEFGNFTLLNRKTNETILAETDGVKDTLAVQVKAVATFAYEEKSCLPDVVADANKMEISAMTLYQPNSAPFAYKNATYCAGKTLTSINFPLKKVTDHTKDQTLTIYVIKQTTTKGFNTNFVKKYELVIPANTFTSNTIDEWYSFDVYDKNIVVGSDETLAFFAPTDTVHPGYKSGANGSNSKYHFYSNTGSLAQEEIYWDVRYKYTGEENQPGAEPEEPGYKQLLEDVDTDFDKYGFNHSSIKKFATETAPYTYQNKNYFGGYKLEKFGMPIFELADHTKENKFTFYVIKKDKASGGSYNQEGNYVSKHELVLPANTFASNTVKEWYYFDISSMNITVGSDETLAFFDPTDTLFPAFLSGIGDAEYYFITGKGQGSGTSTIYFDIQYYDEGSVGEPGYKQLLEDVDDDFYSFGFNSAKLTKYSTKSAPFTYAKDDYFAGYKLEKIGMPIYELTDYTKENKFTFYVIKKNQISTGKYNQEGNYVSKYELVLPANTFASNTVKEWYYFDISSMNITVGSDETLAFFDPTDTLFPAYISAASDSKYYFHASSDGKVAGVNGIYFDIQYYDDGVAEEPEEPETNPNLGYIVRDFEDHLNELIAKEEVARVQAEQKAKLAALAEKLNGKNFSILGDSISTFTGHSNNATNTNSTIGSNAIYYNGSNYITNVDQTWWKQLADKTEMNVLVNNSWSGDRVSTRGQTRCIQLHDDTGINSGTNPDLIAVYLGINDYDGGLTAGSFEAINWATLIVDNGNGTYTYGSASTFAEYYAIMIHKMTVKYNNADVYLFTHVPNGANSRPISDLEKYNDIIKKIAEKYGCSVVDLYNDSGITNANKAEYMGDGSALHPNQAGMDLITECLWNVLYKNYVENNTND